MQRKNGEDTIEDLSNRSDTIGTNEK